VGFELLKGQLHALKDSIIAVTPVAQGARTYFPYLKATVDEPAPRRFGVVTVIFLTNNPPGDLTGSIIAQHSFRPSFCHASNVEEAPSDA
jgi:hypothetical protein